MSLESPRSAQEQSEPPGGRRCRRSTVRRRGSAMGKAQPQGSRKWQVEKAHPWGARTFTVLTVCEYVLREPSRSGPQACVSPLHDWGATHHRQLQKEDPKDWKKRHLSSSTKFEANCSTPSCGRRTPLTRRQATATISRSPPNIRICPARGQPKLPPRDFPAHKPSLFVAVPGLQGLDAAENFVAC